MAQTAEAVKEKEEQTQEESKTQVQNAEFPEAAEKDVTGSKGSIDILLDMSVPITVTIGQTEIPVRRLLQLAPGSVIKIEKPIEEPVDLYLSDSRFATGNVVVVDGNFAVKIKQIIGLNESAAKKTEA